MVTVLYEDPRKAELRDYAAAAIDASGYELLPDPQPIPLPAGAGLRGGILGDLQSLDGNDITHAYYIRPDSDKPVPQWLANLAIAAHDIPNVKVWVVVERVTVEMERSCRACGAGLLRLDVDLRSLEQIVDPDDWDPARLNATFREQVKETRRRMETRLSLKLDKISENYARVEEITDGMASEERDKYIGAVESQGMEWRAWGDGLSVRLDAVGVSRDEDELAAIEREIERGAVGGDDD